MLVEAHPVCQTIVATCVANDVNPQDDITDVLLRVQSHPASQIDDLLPTNGGLPRPGNQPD